jgi:hypothetical protein
VAGQFTVVVEVLEHQTQLMVIVVLHEPEIQVSLVVKMLEHQANQVANVVLHEPDCQVSLLVMVLEYQIHLVATVVFHAPESQISVCCGEARVPDPPGGYCGAARTRESDPFTVVVEVSEYQTQVVGGPCGAARSQVSSETVPTCHWPDSILVTAKT